MKRIGFLENVLEPFHLVVRGTLNAPATVCFGVPRHMPRGTWDSEYKSRRAETGTIAAQPLHHQAEKGRWQWRARVHPGQQQVNLSVEIEVPGSWLGGTEMGSLSSSERRQKYKAQAVEYAEVREFPGASARARKVKEPAIRFICLDDASLDPNSDGYWMQLSQWNRFRHDTFKERPDDEMPFILGTGPSSVLAAELDAGGANPVQSCQIKQVFTPVSQGVLLY